MFTPNFEWISLDYDLAADMINRPHEDYPNRVSVTALAIKQLVYAHVKQPFITDGKTIRGVHYLIMADMPHAGRFRTCQVQIGYDRGVDWWEIDQRFCRIVVHLFNDVIMRAWYREFQTIHPFEDGNGRVGGAIVAAASILIYGDRILVPTQ